MLERLIVEHNQDCYVAEKLGLSVEDYQKQKLKIIEQNLKNALESVGKITVSEGVNFKVGDTITITEPN